MDSTSHPEARYVEIPTLASAPWLGVYERDISEFSPSSEWMEDRKDEAGTHAPDNAAPSGPHPQAAH